MNTTVVSGRYGAQSQILRLTIAALAGLVAAGAAWLFGAAPRLQLTGDRISPSLFAPDGRWLVVEEWTRDNERIQNLVVDTATGEARLRFPGRRLLSLAFSADGRLFARAADYSDSANGIDVWDLQTGAEVERLSWRNLPSNLSGNLPAATLAFSPEGHLLLGSEHLGLWDVEARKRIGDLKPLSPAGAMVTRPFYLDLLGYEDEGNRVRLLSLKTRVVVSEFRVPARLRNYRFSPEGRFLAADFYDRSGIHVADSRTGMWTSIDAREVGLVESLSETSDLLAVASESEWGHGFLRRFIKEPPRSSTIRLYDLGTGRLVDEVPGITALLAPDGSTLAVRTRGGTLELWDLPRPTPWRRCLGAGLAGMGLVLLGQLAWARHRTVSAAGGQR